MMMSKNKVVPSLVSNVVVAPKKHEQVGIEIFLSAGEVDEFEIIPEIPLIEVIEEDLANVKTPPPSESEAAVDPFNKYRTMLKCGLPMGAVCQRIKLDGLDPEKFRHALDVRSSTPEAASVQAKGSISSLQDALNNPEFECNALGKYRTMLKCGLSIEVIEHKMKQDGVSLEAILKGSSSSVPANEVSLHEQGNSCVIAVESMANKPKISNKESAIVGNLSASVNLASATPKDQTAPLIAQTVESVTPAPDIKLTTATLSVNASNTIPAAEAEMNRLISVFDDLGEQQNGETVISFRKLYENVPENTMGLLTRAKKRGLVEFTGEILFKGKDDNTFITLVKENVCLFRKGQPTLPRPASQSSLAVEKSPVKKASISPMKIAPLSNAVTAELSKKLVQAGQQKTPVSAAISSEGLIEPQIIAVDSSVQPKEALSAKEDPSAKVPSVDDEHVSTSKEKPEAAVGQTNRSTVEALVSRDAEPIDAVAAVTKAATDVQRSDPPSNAMIERMANLSTAVADAESADAVVFESGDESKANVARAVEAEQVTEEVSSTTSYVETPGIDLPQPPPAQFVIEPSSLAETSDENETTGRGPPPLPPSDDSNGVHRTSISPPRRRTTLRNSRSPSKTTSIEPMFDIFGRRRSSGTIYRVALTVMDSKTVETIPRDEMTDALNWTTPGAQSNSDEDIFSFENAEGVQLAKALDSLKVHSTAIKRRHSPDQHETATSRAFRNQTQAVVLIQRVMRGWMVRLRYKSCLWVRERLNSAVRSRLPEKVEEALAASRAISGKFVRPPEHEVAVASLDTIREERALRPKLAELSELKADVKDGLRKYASVIDRMNRCRASDPFAFKDEISAKAELVYEAITKRVEMCERLYRARDHLCPSDMMNALRECDAAAARFSGIWEDDFLEHEKTVLREILVAMQHEEPAVIGLLKACTSDDVIFTHPEMIFEQTNFEELEQAIERAVDELGHAPYSPGASIILSLGSAILVLRKSLSAQSHHKGAQSVSWNICEKLLGDARLKLRAWTEIIPEGGVANDSSDYFASWVVIIERELDLISHELDKKAGVHDIISALYDSVERCDIDDIRNVLRKGEKRGLHERIHDQPLQENMALAREYLERFSLIHSRLAEALAGVNRNPIELKKISEEAKQIVIPGSSDALLAAECDRLCERAATELVPEIEKTLEIVPDRKDLEALMERMRKKERMGGIEQLAKVEQLLAMSEPRLVQEQLRAATKAHDEARKMKLTINLRESQLEQNPAMFRFHNFPDLKDPKEWSLEVSSKRLLGTLGKPETRAARMIYSARVPIHAPLTKSGDCNAQARRFALKANRTLLAYTGDLEVDDLSEFGGDICQGLHEVLVYALGDKQVRDEVFCQVMKHLNENRRPGSAMRAWNYLAFCLITFPPSACLDLYVEFFIRNNALSADVQSLLDKLHLAVFVGERPVAPTLSDIKLRQDDGGSVEGLSRRLQQ